MSYRSKMDTMAMAQASQTTAPRFMPEYHGIPRELPRLVRQQYEAARARRLGIRPAVDTEWLRFQNRWASVRGGEAASELHGARETEREAARTLAAIATEAHAFFAALAGLPEAQASVLAAPDGMIADTTEARAVMQEQTGLATWLAWRDAAFAELARRQESMRAEDERRAPQAILDRLRAAGFHLALDPAGRHLVMPPAEAARLARQDHDAVVRLKAEIVRLLRAEAEASRPVVIA